MGLSIWTGAPHAFEGSRNIEAKHDPHTMNPTIGYQSSYESPCARKHHAHAAVKDWREDMCVDNVDLGVSRRVHSHWRLGVGVRA